MSDPNNEKRLIANEIMRQLYADKDARQLEILVAYGKVCLENLAEKAPSRGE